MHSAVRYLDTQAVAMQRLGRRHQRNDNYKAWFAAQHVSRILTTVNDRLATL